MKFKLFVNGCLIAVAITFLVILAFRVNAGSSTANTIAVLKTSGMTCGSCSSKISAALKPLKGVAVTEVDVNGGWVVVGYDSATVNPEQLAQKVSTSGFSSSVYRIMTPEQFRQIAGRDLGGKAGTGSGCCGSNGGCGAAKNN